MTVSRRLTFTLSGNEPCFPQIIQQRFAVNWINVEKAGFPEDIMFLGILTYGTAT